ncbi:MAG: ATP-binding protein [Actinomycetota bacterium]
MEALHVERHARDTLDTAMGYSRVTVLNGPRQAGKTTLARSVSEELAGTYLTMDDDVILAAARNDPVGLIQAAEPIVIDEIQRVGEPMVLAIKAAVDVDPRPGRFLLTGSTRFLTVPTIAESLAGRVDVVDLWPFSSGEVRGIKERFVDRLFHDENAFGSHLERTEVLDRMSYFEIVCLGGFPAVRALSSDQRARWFDSYLRTVLAREVTDLAVIRGARELPRLASLLAARTAQELNVNALSQEIGMRWNTISYYLSLLETAYLFFRIDAWSRNLTAKVVKHPKIHFVDSGLCARLMGVTPASLSSPGHPATGPLMETFVAAEIARQATWAATDVRVSHFRDRGGAEIDIVLESSGGAIAAIEVKAGASIDDGDLRNLRAFRDRAGESFVNGVVLYAGERTVSMGDRLWAAPISAIWAS